MSEEGERKEMVIWITERDYLSRRARFRQKGIERRKMNKMGKIAPLEKRKRVKKELFEFVKRHSEDMEEEQAIATFSLQRGYSVKTLEKYMSELRAANLEVRSKVGQNEEEKEVEGKREDEK